MAGLLRDRRGGHLVEYLILVGLVAIVSLVGFRAFGGSAEAKTEAQAACVSSLDCEASNSGTPSGSAAADGAGDVAVNSATGAVTEANAGAGSEASPSPGKPLWRRPVDFVVGFLKQGWTMFPETLEILRHPIETGKNLWHVVRHPVDTFHAAKEGLGGAWNDNPEDLAGRITWELVSLPFIASKISKLRVVTASQTLVRSSRVAKAAVWANGVRQVAEYGCRTSHVAEAGELAQEEVEPHDHAAGTDIHDPGTPSKK